eukprot:3121417-Pleurochrysis_carterae.AAC.2
MHASLPLLLALDHTWPIGRAERGAPAFAHAPNAKAHVARATAECGTAVRTRARIRRIGARPSRPWPGS